jgi:hypothetical protein
MARACDDGVHPARARKRHARGARHARAARHQRPARRLLRGAPPGWQEEPLRGRHAHEPGQQPLALCAHRDHRDHPAGPSLGELRPRAAVHKLCARAMPAATCLHACTHATTPSAPAAARATRLQAWRAHACGAPRAAPDHVAMVWRRHGPARRTATSAWASSTSWTWPAASGRARRARQVRGRTPVQPPPPRALQCVCVCVCWLSTPHPHHTHTHTPPPHACTRCACTPQASASRRPPRSTCPSARSATSSARSSTARRAVSHTAAPACSGACCCSDRTSLQTTLTYTHTRARTHSHTHTHTHTHTHFCHHATPSRRPSLAALRPHPLPRLQADTPAAGQPGRQHQDRDGRKHRTCGLELRRDAQHAALRQQVHPHELTRCPGRCHVRVHDRRSTPRWLPPTPTRRAPCATRTCGHHTPRTGRRASPTSRA